MQRVIVKSAMLFLAVAALGIIASAPALAFPSQLLPCVSTTPDESSPLHCELDISQTNSVELVRQRSSSGVDMGLPAFVQGASAVSPSIIALALNQGLGNAPFARSKAALAALLNSDNPNVRLGLWSFGTNVRPIAAVGTASVTINAALSGLRNTDDTVELLRSINEIAKQIATLSVRRKVLVIASDGDLDDTAYTFPEIVEVAKAAGIRIVVLFPYAGSEQITRAQRLRRLTDETDGLFWSVTDSGSYQAAFRQVQSFIDRSGYVRVERQAEPTVLEVVLKDGRVLTRAIPSLPPKSAPASEGQPPPMSASSETATSASRSPVLSTSGTLATEVAGEQRFWSAPMRFVIGQPLYVWLGAGGTAFATLALTVWLWSNRKSRFGSELASVQPETVGSLGPIWGWFEFMDGQGSREPVSQSVTRVGRHPDNDLILGNPSVHRFHAVVKRDPSGTFSVMDLGTANGVYLNGVRIKHERLTDGDVLELGEVRMRFKAA